MRSLTLLIITSCMFFSRASIAVTAHSISSAVDGVQIDHSAVAEAKLISQADSEIRVRRMRSMLDNDLIDGEAFLAHVEALRKKLEGRSSD